jgi:tetratricopeptide (TPR) repeat protein
VLSADYASPWLGLASFTEETRAQFHGRDEEVAELGRRVQRKLLTVLFGQSGLGKTSILRAGLVPRLRPEGYCPVYVRLDYGRESPPPAEQIKQAIVRATQAAGHWTQPGVAMQGESLWEFLHHRDDVLRDRTGQPLIPLLIFDQFEEIFTLAQGDDFGRQRAAQFLEELADLVENRAPRALEARLEADEAGMERFDFARADYRLLIALREDYLAHLEGLKGAMPSVTQNRMRLARMSGAQALAAVTRPGRGLVSDAVAAQIVAFVSGTADAATAEVEPSLLSLVCRELDETRRARGHTEISADLLAGSRDTILSEFYARTLADQPEGVRAFIEDELLTDSGYRESIAEERVQKGFAVAGAPAAALATLVDRRLLRVEERLDVRRVELTHDVLCGVVRASRGVRHEREARAAAERQLAETRAKEAATRAQLLRARLVAGACTVLAVGALGAAAWGWVNWRRAEAAEDQAGLARDRAQQARGEAERLVSFLLDDLYVQLEPTGRLEIVGGLAQRALTYFEALPAEFRDARSDRYRAIALSRLGLALSGKGKTLDAEKPLQEAEQLFEGLRKSGVPMSEIGVELAAVLRQQSRNAYSQNRPQLAVPLGRRSLEVIAPLAMAPDASASVRYEFGRVQSNYGFVLLRDRQTDASLVSLDQACAVFRALMNEPAMLQRARVQFGEAAAWRAEALRRASRPAEVMAMLDEALPIADAAVEREAGNLGALRSRALLRGRRTMLALDSFDYATAEAQARQVTNDWTEYLRFDPENDPARNNRRVSQNNQAEAMWLQGRLDDAIALAKAVNREAIEVGGSPSSIRGTAFGVQRVDFIEAEMGRVTDIDAAVATGNRLRELSASQTDPESVYRALTPLWNASVRAGMQLRVGQTAAAHEAARTVESRMAGLNPKTGEEVFAYRNTIGAARRVQVEASLALRRWRDAADVAGRLVAGRPTPDDTSEDALYWLSGDQVLAAVAFARAGDRTKAETLIETVAAYFAVRRQAGSVDYDVRLRWAMLELARSLLASNPAEKRARISAGLAEIAAMPPQPQQLRSVRNLKTVLEQELAQLR